MMLDETSTVDHLAIAFATRHNRSGFFVISAHRCYSLGSVSLLGHPLHLERAHKRIGVVGEVQVHPIYSLLDPQDANGTNGMALLHTRMPWDAVTLAD